MALLGVKEVKHQGGASRIPKGKAASIPRPKHREPPSTSLNHWHHVAKAPPPPIVVRDDAIMLQMLTHRCLLQQPEPTENQTVPFMTLHA